MHPSNRVSSSKPGTVRKSVMSRLKSQTLPSELSTSSEEVEFLPYLSYITDGCVILDIDPSACIPLHLPRFRIDNAVQKLKSILNGNFNNHFGGPNLTGMVSGAPTSIVVPLTGESKSLMISYFKENILTPEELDAAINAHPVWYGAIDGCQLLTVILQLRSELPGQWVHLSGKCSQ